MRALTATLAVTMIIVAGCSSSAPTSNPTGESETVPIDQTTSPATNEGSGLNGSGEGSEEGMSCWASVPDHSDDGISFEDVTAEFGLIDPLTGMHGHAAAWGDPNADGRPDLLVGTFTDRPVERYQVRGAGGPSPDRLLAGVPFVIMDEVPVLEMGRTSGAVFADLDADGDDDLVLSRNAGLSGQSEVASVVLENRDGGLVVVANPGVPEGFLGRSIGVLDADQDGLLDLILVEDRYGDQGTRLLHNVGNMRFEDATSKAGLPEDLSGLGIATADINGDRLTDFFVGGSNRLFIADGPLEFHEVIDPVFEWELFGSEDDVAGAAFGDLNRDGLPDLVVGHHFNSTIDFDERVPVRVYLNKGIDSNDDPLFEDITEAAGMIGLPTKAPHVEIADVDNDGWPDIVTTASSHDGTQPAVFHHAGLIDGIPQFTAPPGLGDSQYWVAGPTADVDRDGLLDIILIEWEPALPSLLLRNTSTSGNWLEISFDLPGRGVGVAVSVYDEGAAGDAESLVGHREIIVSEGYTAGRLPYAHFGLGNRSTADAVIHLPDGEILELNGLAANQHVRVPGGCQD